MEVVWETKTGIRRGENNNTRSLSSFASALKRFSADAKGRPQKGRSAEAAKDNSDRARSVAVACERYCYHPDENRNVALTHAARSVSTGANSRNAAAKAQANTGKNSRTMPALGLSMVVYGTTQM